LVALGESPGQLRALFVQSAFEDDRGRLGLQAHCISIDRDCVNRDSRALIKAVYFTGVNAGVRFRHGQGHAKLSTARFKRALPHALESLCLDSRTRWQGGRVWPRHYV
jgi:hypothetical protein